MHAIRGAIQIDRNEAPAIDAAVCALVAEIVRRNRLRVDAIVSAWFTLTPDLDAAFPAKAAREAGWGAVPMLCAQEIPVPGALPRVCRVLLHVRGKPIAEQGAEHVYLGGAEVLRPDWTARRAAAAPDARPDEPPSSARVEPRARGKKKRRA